MVGTGEERDGPSRSGCTESEAWRVRPGEAMGRGGRRVSREPLEGWA